MSNLLEVILGERVNASMIHWFEGDLWFLQSVVRAGMRVGNLCYSLREAAAISRLFFYCGHPGGVLSNSFEFAYLCQVDHFTRWLCLLSRKMACAVKKISFANVN